MLGIKERVRSVGTRGGWHWNGVLEVTFPSWGVRGDSAWPLVSPEQQLSARGYGVNAGWVLMLVLLFFSFSCLPPDGCYLDITLSRCCLDPISTERISSMG